MSGVSTSETGQDRKISFKKFIETRASENIFDNDVSDEDFNCLFIATWSLIQVLGNLRRQRS
jgi:hypothetical protein